MPFINYAAREINCKIVYYGPGLGGKTSNLQQIYDKTPDNTRGRLVSLATENERTVFFDFLPLDLGSIKDFKTRFHLYTVPGQLFYEESRKIILKGADGVVFVADSLESRIDANLEALAGLKSHLTEQGQRLENIPYVLQLNKRDAPGILTVEKLTRELAQNGEPLIAASARTGEGIFDTLKTITRLILMDLRAGIQPEGDK